MNKQAYSQNAALLRDIASRVREAPSVKFQNAQELAIYHLRAAAQLLSQIAEVIPDQGSKPEPQ